MAQQAISLLPDVFKGSIRVSGTAVPSGHVVVTRTSGREIPTIIRGGEFDVSTGGFLRQDTDPSYGIPVTYRATVSGISRLVQTNRVLNPKAKDNTNNWATNSSRALTRETSPALAPLRDAVTSLKIGANVGGTSGGAVADRLLASTTPSGFGPGRWFVSGQLRFDNSDLWLWEDVKSAGTWQTIKDKGTWQQVRSASSEGAGEAYTSLWAAVVSPTDLTPLTAPIQILGLPSSAGNSWLSFNAWITVPADAPAGARLAFLQGTQVREYANEWWLSTVMATPEAEMDSGSLTYLDGDTPLPANPAANLIPEADWQPLYADASITWNGTTNNSVSVFTGPSAVTATATATLQAPTVAELGVKAPILLSDPVTTSLGAWFELLAIGELSFKERADLYDVLGRGPQIAVSQLRAWASGQLTLMTYTLDDIALVERMFGFGRILLMRNPDPRYPETDWYLHIGEVKSARVGPDYARPERAWTVPFVRVERPVGLIEGSAGTTWAQAKAGYTSWGDARNRRRDWLEGALEPAR